MVEEGCGYFVESIISANEKAHSVWNGLAIGSTLTVFAKSFVVSGTQVSRGRVHVEAVHPMESAPQQQDSTESRNITEL